VYLQIKGPKDIDSGMLINFTDIKAAFRKFLDTDYDHHMLLHPDDPAIDGLSPEDRKTWGITLMEWHADPTVENFALTVLAWAKRQWSERHYRIHVRVEEGPTNAVEVGDADPLWEDHA
jgi:6-pyruvoyl-tetrahydropterin synthase